MRLFRLLFLTNCLILAVTASAQTITCSSNDMGRHYCRANTSNGVKLVYQRSGSACTMGVSWGYDNSGIWVDHGCRADFAVSGGNGQGGNHADSNNALLMCKNAASQHLSGVPLAYIGVYRGTDPDPGNYMINFRAQPPNQRQSSGFCIVSKSGQLRNFQFDAGSSPGNGGGGNNYGGASPNTAMQLCKDVASSHLPNVPRAYIAVYRGTDTGNGSYMINFHAQPPNQRQSSGFCIVSKNGQLQNFQFDPGSGRNQGGGNYGGGNNNGEQTSQDVMIACKNAVNARMPNVPLAYIQVNQPRVNGGSMLSNFRVQPPSGPYASGSCDVFKNGRVNLQFNN